MFVLVDNNFGIKFTKTPHAAKNPNQWTCTGTGTGYANKDNNTSLINGNMVLTTMQTTTPNITQVCITNACDITMSSVPCQQVTWAPNLIVALNPTVIDL